MVPRPGRGQLPNSYVEMLLGETRTTPYSTGYRGVSLLERRFWGGDARLDQEHPPGGGDPYTDFPAGTVLPVMPGRIVGVLVRGDRFRAIRNTWFTVRTRFLDGTFMRWSRLWKTQKK